MSTFVEVPADKMFDMLEAAGFSRCEGRSRREIVYARAHDLDPTLKVLVYTSIAADQATARACGSDAIRVAAIGERGERSWGIAKLPRIHRTGTVEGVLERTLARMREAYARLNRFRKGEAA